MENIFACQRQIWSREDLIFAVDVARVRLSVPYARVLPSPSQEAQHPLACQ